MNTASLLGTLTYQDDKPAIQLLMETDFTKEIRILLRAGQSMKRHQTPYPIVVEVVAGSIDFGVEAQTHTLSAGDLISLSGGVLHDLHAHTDSIVRLTLAKGDQASRVSKVAAQS